MYYYDKDKQRILNLDHFAIYKVVFSDGQYEVRAFYATAPPEWNGKTAEPWEVLCKGSKDVCERFLQDFSITIEAAKPIKKLSVNTATTSRTQARGGR